MDDFEKELKNGFLEESKILLEEMEQCFLELESSSEAQGLLDKIFRIAHNIKGSSRAVGFEELGAYTHEFESLLLKIKNNEIQINPPIVSLLLRCKDHLFNFIQSLKSDLSAHVDSAISLSEIKAAMSGQYHATHDRAETISEAKSSVQSESLSTVQSVSPSEVQSAASVDSLTVPDTKIHIQKPKEVRNQSDEQIRVSMNKLQKLIDLVGEMVILQSVLKEQSQITESLLMKKTVTQLGKISKEIQDVAMGLRMLPIKPTFQKMQRIVRDTSAQLGKKVDLIIEGEETAVDKTVLESIGDPLVHLVRNAVDHGIENPEKRIQIGKPETGLIRLIAKHEGGKLVIEVRDDGGGIPPEVIKRKAVEKGILKPDAVISDQEAIQFIFHPGFSTKEVVTDVSGRGVGMDVVKTNIESMQGSIDVTSELGKGSCFKVILPLTLAIIEGIIVKAENHKVVLPLSQVSEIYRPETKAIQENSRLGRILLIREKTIPLIRLSDLLMKRNLASLNHELNSEGAAIVIATRSGEVAVWVDEVLHQQQIVIKPLGKELTQIPGAIGTAILGDGKPSIILELSGYLQSRFNKLKEGMVA